MGHFFLIEKLSIFLSVASRRIRHSEKYFIYSTPLSEGLDTGYLY